MDFLRKLVSALIERSTGGGRMITRLLEWEVDFGMWYCCTLKVVPFSWDPVTGQLSLLNTQSYEHKAWTTLSILSLLHCGLMWLRFYVSIQNGDSFVTLTLVFFSAVVLSVPSTCQATIYFHAPELTHFFNSQMLLFKRIEEFYWRTGALPYGKIIEHLFGFVLIVSIVQPYMFAIFYWYKPFSKIFLLSSTFLDGNSLSILIFLAGVPVFFIAAHGWATALFFTFGFAQFIFLGIFITKSISANYRGSQTLDTLRIPLVAFKVYSSLQLLTQRANDIVQSALFVIVNLDLAAIVAGNSLLIVYHRSLSTLLFVAVGTCSLSVSLLLIVMHVVLAEFHEYSKIFVSSWKVKEDYRLNEKNLLRKLFKSCRLNRIEMGSTGSFKRPTVIRLVGKIVFYTAKFLLVLTPHSGDGRGLD